VARDLGDVDVGQDLAQRVCATCHRVQKGETDEKFLDVAAFQTLANNPAKTALSLRVFLKSPHRDMPDLILSEAEIDGVIAYIQSLKRRNNAR
jgi:cytochrome c